MSGAVSFINLKNSETMETNKTKATGYSPAELVQSKEYRLLQAVALEINNGNFNMKRFAEGIGRLHPTVQQLLFKLMKTCALHMAEPGNVRIDSRNRCAYEGCRAIADTLEDIRLPLI